MTIPGLLSFMSENDPGATVQGVNDLQARGEAVRRRRLHPQPAGHLLVVPADDRPRAASRSCSRWPASGCPAAAGAGAALVRPRPRRSWWSRRSSPTPSAGSSPRWAGSPGSWCRTRPGRTRCGCSRLTVSRRPSARPPCSTSLIAFTLALRRAGRGRAAAAACATPRPARADDTDPPRADDVDQAERPHGVRLLRRTVDMELTDFWFGTDRRAVDRLLLPRGLRLRRRRPAAGARPGPRPTAAS